MLFWLANPMPRNLPHLLRGARVLVLWAAMATFWLPAPVWGQEGLSYYAQRALKMHVTGDYAEAEEYCERVLGYGSEDVNLARIHIQSELALGKYEEAAASAAEAAKTFSGYVPMQIVVVDALRRAGKDEEAKAALVELDAVAKKLNPKTLKADELVALGRAALLLGAEPKMVLANFFQRARQLDAELLDGHLAAAEVALSKADYALASRILHQGRSKVGSFPDLLYPPWPGPSRPPTGPRRSPFSRNSSN